MFKRLSFVTFILISFSCAARPSTIDSLKLKLNSAKGKEQIEILYNLGYHYIELDSLKSRDYINQGILLAKENNYQDLIVSGKIQDAYIDHIYHLNYSSMDKSLEVLQSGYSLSIEDSAMVIGILGSVLTEMKAYEYAIEYRKILVDINFRHHRDNPYYPLENVAYLFAKINQYDSANYYYERALDVALKVGNKNWEMHCLNNMGFNYQSQENYSKAEERYQLAINNFNSREEVPQVNDTILFGIVLGNIATISLKKNNFQEALSYRKKANKYLSQNNNEKIWLQNILSIADISQHLELFQESNAYLDSTFHHLNNYPQLQTQYYQLKSTYYESNGEQSKAISALKRKIEIQDNIISEKQMDYKVNDFIHFQSNQIKNELELQQKLQENNEKINSLQLQLTVGTTTLIVIILLILFIKYITDQKRKSELIIVENKLHQAKIENQKIESVRLNEKLAKKNNDLTDFAIDISRKQDFIKELIIKFKELKKSKSIDNESFNNLISYTKSQSIIDRNLKLFQDNVDKVNHEFTSLLENRFPNLTQNEIQLCSLLRLQLSSKEIASVKNITPESVKVLRSRLRKKLNIETGQDLQQFILKIK